MTDPLFHEDQWFTHQDVNSIPRLNGVIDAEATPYSQLRQAELIERRYEQALKSLYRDSREFERKKKLIQARLRSLRNPFTSLCRRMVEGIVPLFTQAQVEIEALEDELEALNQPRSYHDSLIRETKLSLGFAIAKKKELLNLYPELAQKSFEKLQLEEVAQDLLETKVNVVVTKMLMRDFRVPEYVAHLLVNNTPEVNIAILRKSSEKIQHLQEQYADLFNPESAKLEETNGHQQQGQLRG